MLTFRRGPSYHHAQECSIFLFGGSCTSDACWAKDTMRARFRDFDPQSFSFHKDPVLILEEFWSPQELTRWQAAMSRQTWKSLSEMPDVSQAFPNAGNWAKAPINGPEAAFLLDRASLPCIAEYIESFQ